MMQNSFAAVFKLLSNKEFPLMTFAERMNLFFIDFSIMPLLVFENYLKNFECKLGTG